MRFIIYSILVLLAFNVLIVEAKPQKRPNIILIMADDLGYNGLGSYGNQEVKTPNLDALAEKGVRFTDFHSNGSVCSPTRASLMIGQYQHRVGIEGVITAAGHRHVGLDLEATTMAEALKEQGYKTAMAGKWHLGYDPKFFPHNQGFDQFVGFVSGNIDYHSHIDQTGVYDWWDKDKSIKEEGYSTDLITDHAISFIKRNKDNPFFLYVAHEAPHYPYQNRTDKADRTVGGKFPVPGSRKDVDKAYAEMTEIMDEGIGDIMQTLEDQGIDEHTLVVFISDNGGPGKIKKINAPLKGSKGGVWEGGHRVPAIMYWKGKTKTQEVEDVTMTMDLMPTFLALTKSKKTYKSDGIDLSDLLFKGKRLKDRAVFWRTKGNKAVREGDWKYLVSGGGEEFLFNLKQDIAESNNLIKTNLTKASQLKGLLEEWETEVGTLNYTN